ncbi:MAG: DUF2339 domain-containing protein [Gallionella sp.]|nr:DUF2339 domain-containing protein [Gallionella sp.]
MLSLILFFSVVALFVILLTYEASGDESQVSIKPAGLLTWLMSGNWPAKVGAGLVIVGVGALLKYAFANIDVAPETKLASGALLTAALGIASKILKKYPKRRAIHLALAGSAFGVAYLTAYSAYGFFNYINEVNALALLALVSIAAGVFAITNNVMSVAILAMVGAYIAPKFAIGQPDIFSIYGYYFAASVLSLVMVTLRGWRPLIHLSFLFTLAGTLFFGWNGKFYAPEYYSIMHPFLLALISVHVAMPLLERKCVPSAQLKRFDSVYFIILPMIASALMLKIAPDLNRDGAIGLLSLALIWGIASATQYANNKSVAIRHSVVTLLLGLSALLLYVENLPWLLIGLGLSVTAMAAAPKLSLSRSIEELLCVAATLFGVLHIINSILLPAPYQPFINELFTHRVIAGFLMALGGWIGSRRSIDLSNTLYLTGVGWSLLAVLAELLRMNIDFLPQLTYGVILAAIALNIRFNNKLSNHSQLSDLLIFALVLCGWWAAKNCSPATAVSYLLLTPAALLGIAWAGRNNIQQGGTDFSPSMAIGLLPFALLPWGSSTSELFHIETDFFEATIAMIGIGAAGFSARYWLSNSPRWNNRIQPLHVYFTAITLLLITLFYIKRGIWPIMFELLAVAYLVAYVTRRNREQSGVGFGVGAMMVMSVALVMQAMLLRAFGPDKHVMNAADINSMHLPAVASLMWVIFGAGLTWLGTRSKSRAMWSAGSVLLLVSAAKLVLFDFGSLGQLGNILAFIAAGMVFLGVAWFAPPPAKAEPKPTKTSSSIFDTPEYQALSLNNTSQPIQHLDFNNPPSESASEGLAYSAPPVRKPDPIEMAVRRNEPNGGNKSWIILLGTAIVIALFFSALNKHTRWLASQAQVKHQQQIALNEFAQFPTAAPAALASMQHPAPTAMPPQTCSFQHVKFPAEFKIYAAGAYAGKSTNFQIDQSGHQATQMDITVNQPDQPVALILGAYEPTIWNIGWTPDTNIVAVLVSGYHRQVITGLNSSIPVLSSHADAQGVCDAFYISSEEDSRINPISNKLFGRSVDQIYLANNGKALIGNALSAGSPPPIFTGQNAIASFREPNTPLAGIAGIEEALRSGTIRRATQRDVVEWEVNHYPNNTRTSSARNPSYLLNSYVVLKEFTYPAGLYGANSAIFFIPRGVPKPTGNPGHSTVNDYNQ